MKINKDILLPYLIYNAPFQYNKNIILYPVKMDNVILFETLSASITLRKDSIFFEKQIIKMSYLDFLTYSFKNIELEKKYNISNLSNYFFYALQLLCLCCKDAKINISQETGQIIINGEPITPKIFDDLRRIIILQNDIDFDIDEFINFDTEERLKKANKDFNKNKKTSNIEDYIDSLIIALNITEETVMNMTIRKFWRYIKRFQMHENYIIAKTGECSGMISFKNPIDHWMTSFDENENYENLKTNENDLRNKMG